VPHACRLGRGTTLATRFSMHTNTSEPAFVDRVAEIGGLGGAARARRAIHATILTLGERIPEPMRETIAQALPDRFGRVFRAQALRALLDDHDLFATVGERENVNLGFAREHTQIVCRAIGEHLDDDEHAAMHEHLPLAIAELFDTPLIEPVEVEME
jgi:uncharacterized protein (DUF2267 family)